MWVGVGAALGAGGTLWARRRVGLLTERMRSGALAGDVAAIADRGARGAARRVQHALEAGRDGARRREDQLWQELEVRARAR
jgi:hypothetical protein